MPQEARAEERRHTKVVRIERNSQIVHKHRKSISIALLFNVSAMVHDGLGGRTA